MIIIPLQALPNQALRIVLNGQACAISVYQKGDWLYLDMALPGGPVLNTMMCLNRVLLVRQAYLGFIGDLAFVDTQGATSPVYTGLGPAATARYLLVYLTPEDLAS